MPQTQNSGQALASRILAPHTKLATTRWWHTTTLAEDFGVADANENDLYAAMDWLLQHQNTIYYPDETRCRAYLATLRKQGRNVFHALTLAFQGHPPDPLPSG